jgi:hypothetical protein
MDDSHHLVEEAQTFLRRQGYLLTRVKVVDAKHVHASSEKAVLRDEMRAAAWKAYRDRRRA